MNQSFTMPLAHGNGTPPASVSGQAGVFASPPQPVPVPSTPILLPQPPRDGMLAAASAEAARKAEAIRTASSAIGVLVNRLASLNQASELDLAETLEVLGKIKWSQKKAYFDALPRQSEPMVKMCKQLCMFLRKLVTAVSEGRLSMASLGAADIHLVCNGLSACFGADQRDCLLSAQQLSGLSEGLQVLNRELIIQAMKRGLPANLKSNGMLIDILNWQSRGLKHGLFSSQDLQIRTLFLAALNVMKQWPLQPHAPGLPLTEAGRLDMRQLGKCMVQLNAMLKYELIDLVSPQGQAARSLLGGVALGLCGNAPHEFMLWQRSAQRQWQLVPVPPQAVPVSNIANTVKDFVAAGLMPASAPALSGMIGRLMAWMRNLPQEEMLDRGGQSLANCSNFLRALTEPAFQGVVQTPDDTAVFHHACQRMLFTAETFIAGRPDRGAVQTLVNLVSFVKAMDKLGRQSDARLAQLGKNLLAAIGSFVDGITGADSVSGLLAGLVYFSRHHLAEAGQIYPLLSTLVSTAATRLNQFSSSEARVNLIEGILLHLSVAGDAASTGQCLAALETLLQAFHGGCDRLPYLKAARHLLVSGREPAELQAVLRRLLNRADGEVLGLAELDAALTTLKADGQTVPIAPLSTVPDRQAAYVPASGTPDPVAAETKRPGPTYRAPKPPPTGGMRGGRTTTAITTTTTTTATTTATFDAMLATAVAPDDARPGWYGTTWRLREEARAPAAPPPQASASGINKPATQAAKMPANASRMHGMAGPSGIGGGAGKAAPPGGRQQKSSAKSGPAVARGAAAPHSPDRPLSPEEEWFARLMQTGSESLEKLKQLAKAKPALLEAVMDHAQGKRGGLYLSLAGGKPGVVAWLRRAVPPAAQPEPAQMLDMLFSDPGIVLIGDSHKEALRRYLQLLPRQQRRQLLERFMPDLSSISAGYREVLEDSDMLASAGLSKPQAPQHSASQPPPVNADTEARRVDDEGNTALMRAVLNKQADIVRTLLKPNAHQEQAMRANDSGDIPLHCAIHMGATQITSMLLALDSASAQAKLRDAEGRNALIVAVSCARRAELRMLLAMESASEQAVAINKYGNNALMIAAMYGLTDVARDLLALPSASRQAATVNLEGCNASMIASREGHEDIADLLAGLQ